VFSFKNRLFGISIEKIEKKQIPSPNILKNTFSPIYEVIPLYLPSFTFELLRVVSSLSHFIRKKSLTPDELDAIMTENRGIYQIRHSHVLS